MYDCRSDAQRDQSANLASCKTFLSLRRNGIRRVVQRVRSSDEQEIKYVDPPWPRAPPKACPPRKAKVFYSVILLLAASRAAKRGSCGRHRRICRHRSPDRLMLGSGRPVFKPDAQEPRKNVTYQTSCWPSRELTVGNRVRGRAHGTATGTTSDDAAEEKTEGTCNIS